MGEVSLLDDDEAAGFMALLRSLIRILWRVLVGGDSRARFLTRQRFGDIPHPGPFRAGRPWRGDPQID